MRRLLNSFSKLSRIALLVALSVAMSCSCSRIKDIRLLSCAVESVSPIGLHGLNAELAVQVQNPAMQFTLTDIAGVLYYKGDPIVNYDADPIEVAARSVAVYPLPCKATLASGVRLMDLISLMRGYDLNDFTTDVSAKVHLRSGLSKTLKFKDIPVKDLLE